MVYHERALHEQYVGVKGLIVLYEVRKMKVSRQKKTIAPQSAVKSTFANKCSLDAFPSVTCVMDEIDLIVTAMNQFQRVYTDEEALHSSVFLIDYCKGFNAFFSRK